MTTLTAPRTSNGTKTTGTVPTAPRPSPLAIMAQKFGIEPGKLYDVLKATVMKSTDKHQVTNEEVAAFVIVANQYGLNPFTKEIHAFADKSGGIVPIVGVDGWTHIVNAQESFDGLEFEEHSNEEGGPVATTCVIYVKGRSHPIKVTEWLSECRRNTIPWQTMPRRMLRNRAFIQAARLTFGLSGIYDEDEGRDIVRQQMVQVASTAEPETRQVPTVPNTKTDRLAERLTARAAPAQATGEVVSDEHGEVVEAAAEVQQSPPEPGAEASELDYAAKDMHDDLLERVRQAETVRALSEVGAELSKHQATLGIYYQPLHQAYNARYAELVPPKAKK